MFSRAFVRPKAKSEGEKPFWISYADLMTAMMTLFLAAMAVTIIAITRKLDREASASEIYADEILQICKDIANDLKSQGAITVDCKDNRISFGELGRFGYKDFRLPQGAGKALADLVPVVLNVADGPLGKKWLKQVVIEGYTDINGGYLYNLDLSMKRSQWVMCLLLDPEKNTDLGLSPDQMDRVRKLFLAGGVSFNGTRATDDASRRVEMRLQFYGKDEQVSAPPDTKPKVQPAEDRCQI